MSDLFPHAPTSADDASVLLWAVSVVVAALVITVLQLWRVMNRNQSECREENKRAWEKCDEQTKRIEHLLTTALVETQNVARAAISEAEKNRLVLERNTKVIDGLESGRYRARDS